jgi:chloride channel protein, CIC family
VVEDSGQMLGLVTRSDVLEKRISGAATAAELISRTAATVLADESCRAAAERMAEAVVGRLAVVAADDARRLLGIVRRSDLLKPRSRSVEEESKRERFFRLGHRRKAAATVLGLGGSRNRP